MSSLLEEYSFRVLPEVDSSLFVSTFPFLLSKISLDNTSSLQPLPHEVPSFDVESSEDRSTNEYVLSKDSKGVVWYEFYEVNNSSIFELAPSSMSNWIILFNFLIIFSFLGFS